MRKPRGGVKEHRRVSCSSRLLLPAPLSLSFFAERFLETPSTGVTASSTKKRASRTQRAQRCCRGLARCDPPAAPSGRPMPAAGRWLRRCRSRGTSRRCRLDVRNQSTNCSAAPCNQCRSSRCWAATSRAGRARTGARGRRHNALQSPEPRTGVDQADLFGSQIQGDLIGASQWRIYQGVAKEFGSATSDSFP